MLPIEIVRKIMLYNIHPLAVVMKYYIIEHKDCELAFLQEYEETLDQSFQDYMQGEYLDQVPFMFLTKPVDNSCLIL